MKERPILFQGDMVRAILGGSKTMTRRVVKFPTRRWGYGDDYRGEGIDHWRQNEYDQILWSGWGYGSTTPGMLTPETPELACPYGVPGDRLYCKEAWFAHISYDESKPSEIPDPAMVWYQADDPVDTGIIGRYRAARFMPRWACWLVPDVVSVRVERIQSISAGDARAEGVAMRPYVRTDDSFGADTLLGFRDLWDSINARPKPVRLDGEVHHYVSYPWGDEGGTREHRGKPWLVCPNPWVWAVEFKQESL